MNRYPEIVKLITKYALLLSIIYGIEMLVRYSLRTFYNPAPITGSKQIDSLIVFALSVVGNIVAMFFVMKDKKKFQIQNRFLEILTFFYRPIGVCVLLIQVILNESKEIDKKEVLPEK